MIQYTCFVFRLLLLSNKHTLRPRSARSFKKKMFKSFLRVLRGVFFNVTFKINADSFLGSRAE